MTETADTQKKTFVTDGQDLAEKAADLKKNGVTDVTVVVNTFNDPRYKESNEGKELQPVIDGINRAVGEGLNIRLDVGLKEGFLRREDSGIVKQGAIHTALVGTFDVDVAYATLLQGLLGYQVVQCM